MKTLTKRQVTLRLNKAMRVANKAMRSYAEVMETDDRQFSILVRDRADKNGFIIEVGELHKQVDEHGFEWVCPESYGNRTPLEEMLYDFWKSVVEKEAKAQGLEVNQLIWNFSHNFRSGYRWREGWGCFSWEGK